MNFSEYEDDPHGDKDLEVWIVFTVLIFILTLISLGIAGFLWLV